jgi:cold-inducible RNA-binding protein
MSTNIYVGNLTFSTNSSELESLFAEYGRVTSAQVITDRETGRSRGFGFVEMESDADAEKAIADLDGKEVGGRTLKVNVARPRR